MPLQRAARVYGVREDFDRGRQRGRYPGVAEVAVGIQGGGSEWNRDRCVIDHTPGHGRKRLAERCVGVRRAR